MRAEQPIVVVSNIIIDDLWLADGTHFPNMLGGAAVYAAVGAALWWDQVGIVAGVGADLAEVTGGELERFGLRPEGHRVRAPHSIQSQLVYRGDGSRMETPSFGREHFDILQVTPADIPPALLPAAGTYIFRDLDEGFWREVARRRDRLGTIIWELQDDAAFPALWPRIAACLELVDLFSLNEAEAEQLFGSRDPETVLPKLLDTGISAALLRMGGRGAAIATRTERFRLVPPRSKVVDVTGGGNAFTGGFLAGWLASAGDARRAARCAAASAAHALGQYGPANPKDRALPLAWAEAAEILPVNA